MEFESIVVLDGYQTVYSLCTLRHPFESIVVLDGYQTDFLVDWQKHLKQQQANA